MGRAIEDNTTSNLICQLNSRFDYGDPISEIAAVHRAENIFAPGKKLSDAYRRLQIVPKDAKEQARWFEFLDKILPTYQSNVGQNNGHDAIVKVHRENLESDNPQPVFVAVHMASDDTYPTVKISKGRPIIYSPNRDYIVMSIPVTPAGAATAVPALMSVARRKSTKRCQS